LQVVERHVRLAVSDARHSDHPRRRTSLQDVEQQVGKQEGTKVIDPNVRSIPSSVTSRLTLTEPALFTQDLELRTARNNVRGLRADLCHRGDRSLAPRVVAGHKDQFRTHGGKLHARLKANARCCSGDKGCPSRNRRGHREGV
jgi:hypothetical protein